MTRGGPRIAVIGGGWAGLAAAVRAAQAGAAVELFEMAATAGGRARTIADGNEGYDNGQHILIGAYRRCLALMRSVGVDPNAVLERLPLALVDPSGHGLRLPGGHPAAAFARAVAQHPRWSIADRGRLLWHAARWGLQGFRCDPDRSVHDWAGALPRRVFAELIDPLCVAALNTPAQAASAAMLLTVLRDGLFGGPGSADLLLPKQNLGELLPEAGVRWLRQFGHGVTLSCRVGRVEPGGDGSWTLDVAPQRCFDAVVLACSAREAARLAAPWQPAWTADAAQIGYEPICTAWVTGPASPWPAPMVMLPGGPAQFAFDHGALGGQPGESTLVCSGARTWVVAGPDALRAALESQLAEHRHSLWPAGSCIRRLVTEKRATFACVPGLKRPRAQVANRLVAAGDYVEGPYPATLEGAVRSGEAAVEQLLGSLA